MVNINLKKYLLKYIIIMTVDLSDMPPLESDEEEVKEGK